MPRKVIFLDIDGVMNSFSTRPQDPQGLLDFLDPANIGVLNAVVAASGAVVVVTSTWRLTMPFAELQATFASAGCVAEIVDVTPDIDAPRREVEVEAWLAAQAEAPARFVVIDDDFEMPAFPEKLVRTRKLHGLCAGDMPAVLALLAD